LEFHFQIFLKNNVETAQQRCLLIPQVIYTNFTVIRIAAKPAQQGDSCGKGGFDIYYCGITSFD